MEMIERISKEMNLPDHKISAVIQLLDQGATIPFIARYRKEQTGSLDEVVVTDIRDRIEQLNALDDRKKAILKSLTDRGLLTETLGADVQKATSLIVLEDVYERYRPKKRTRAQMARQRGLEPLADFLLVQSNQDPLAEAKKYVSTEKEVETPEQALAGARDIVAEIINEDVHIRAGIRKLFLDTAQIQSAVKKGKEADATK